MSVALVEGNSLQTPTGTIAAVDVVIGTILLGYSISSQRPVWVEVTGIEWHSSADAYSIAAQGLLTTTFPAAAHIWTDQGNRSLSTGNPFQVVSPCAVNRRNLLRRRVNSLVQTTDEPYLVVQFSGADCLIVEGYLIAEI